MGIIALAGGNEFRANCTLMDQRLLSLLPHSPVRVVILPTAAVQGSPRMAAENGVRYFASLGASASAAMIVTRADADNPDHVQALDEADLVYLAGGDPGYLLDVLRGSALLAAMQKVYERGGLIAGSSAGAMVLSKKMRVWNKGEWVPGLGWADRVAALVHHDGPAPATLRTLKDEHEPLVMGIAEATAAFSSDGRQWEVAGVGSISVYSGDTMTRYTHGQRFAL